MRAGHQPRARSKICPLMVGVRPSTHPVLRARLRAVAQHPGNASILPLPKQFASRFWQSGKK